MAARTPDASAAGVPEHRAVVLWRKPPEEEEYDRKMFAARTAEVEARAAKAELLRHYAELKRVGVDLVLSQFQKWLAMSLSPDFQNSVGPIDPATVMKIAEFVSKEQRLDTGQATENIAHAIATSPSLDFSKLTQKERDQWRALALKGGG